jgi:GNAT superfamily N-acetyltransferase
VTQIREYRPADVQAVVDLSLRAWTPVFASLERILGRELFTRLHGEWRGFQETAVRGELADGAVHAWVAEAGPGVIGFVTAALRDPQRGLGEIGMLAVDPGAQDRGVGTALTEFATDWLRRSGMRVAMVGTGGDPSHAPARRVYEKAGYTLLPLARYFRAL